MSDVKKLSSQQEKGVHIVQLRGTCDWDEETQKVSFVQLVGYDGEDFLELDFETLTWIALQPRAIPVKRVADTDEVGIMILERTITKEFPVLLKLLLDKGKSILLRTEHPSLSLLQKSPSSPVSCHATGFYPSKALMFWRKDGEEFHENVDHGEILPNHDGTFQMRVYLDISSINPEDWRRYDCVFQLIGKVEKIIKLDEATLRINRESPSNISLPIIAVVIALVLVSIAAAAAVGHVVYKKKIVRDPLPSTSHENGTELTETLNPEI
ncbi:major histocompatibility complex class I-related gene protein-like [Fundulus heteroclitus]|uniref:major histocompatibility complex class I-related gene protein-like n=1 Tax=Fundulus heteroclitus TaxID=8078 RepID=UPI00165AB999|nr:major histocompatibility complex class I-related gene protein-like [Fundulus heteroclitus]